MKKEDVIKFLNDHKGNDTDQILDLMKFEWSSKIQPEIEPYEIESDYIKKAEKRMLKKYKKNFKSWWEVWWPEVEKEFRNYIVRLNTIKF